MRLLFVPVRPFQFLGGRGVSTFRSAGGVDPVAVSTDLSAFLGGDELTVGVTDLVELSVASARRDAGDEHGCEGADRGVVVFAPFDVEPVVAGGEGGVDLAGQIRGEEQGLA